MRETQEGEASQVELFLNSVPLLASLAREEKLALLDALDKQVFAPGVRVINQARLAQHTCHVFKNSVVGPLDILCSSLGLLASLARSDMAAMFQDNALLGR